MFPILWWALWVLFDSFATVNYKQAIEIWKMSRIMFKIYAVFFNLLVFICLFFVFWFEEEIFSNPYVIILIFFTSFIHLFDTLLWLYVYKTTKLSELLPYQNLDKLFIVLIWFFLYAGVEDKEVSLFTFVITLLTIFVVTILTIDFKNIKIPKTIWIFILNRILKSSSVVLLWYILISYSTVTYWSINVLFELIIYIWVASFMKDSFNILFTQSKLFYKFRVLAVLFWISSFVIWLFIVEKTWIIIASLLGFLSIVFNIFMMKIFLKDNPTTKQMVLAFIVISMIWIGYYFK